MNRTSTVQTWKPSPSHTQQPRITVLPTSHRQEYRRKRSVASRKRHLCILVLQCPRSHALSPSPKRSVEQNHGPQSSLLSRASTKLAWLPLLLSGFCDKHRALNVKQNPPLLQCWCFPSHWNRLTLLNASGLDGSACLVCIRAHQVSVSQQCPQRSLGPH